MRLRDNSYCLVFWKLRYFTMVIPSHALFYRGYGLLEGHTERALSLASQATPSFFNVAREKSERAWYAKSRA